jgi:hypothetical protein
MWDLKLVECLPIAWIVTIFVLAIAFCGSAIAQSSIEETENWRPIVDNGKCAAAIVWAVPTLAGLGNVCFTANKTMISSYRPVLQTLIEMGCVAPLSGIENPKYYTFAKEMENQGLAFACFIATNDPMTTDGSIQSKLDNGMLGPIQFDFISHQDGIVILEIVGCYFMASCVPKESQIFVGLHWCLIFVFHDQLNAFEKLREIAFYT